MRAVSSRRTRYLLVSALALALGLWGAQGLWGLSAPPADGAGADLSYPARVGPVTVGSPAELRFLLQSHPSGSVVEVASGSVVHRIPLVPQLSRPHFYLVLFEGLLFLAVSHLVFWPRLDRGPVRDFYWCTLLYGVAILIGGIYFPRTASWTEWVLPAAWIACLGLLPVLFLHMSLTFPRRSGFLDRHPAAMAALAAVGVGLVLWQWLAYGRYFLEPGPAAWRSLLLPRALAAGYLVSSVAAGCIVLYRRSAQLELSRERDQVKWLLWGFTVGVTPYVFLRTLPGLLGVPPPLPAEFDRLAELAIPLAFTFAVVRYRFLDIDIIIRRSLIYGISAGVLTAGYLLAGLLVARTLRVRFPDYGDLLELLVVAAPVVLFTTTRRHIGTWVDRTFFKIRYDHGLALVEFRRALQSSVGPQQLADIVQSFLLRALMVKQAAVLVRQENRWVYPTPAGREPHGDALARLERLFLPAPRLVAAPESTGLPEWERDDFPADVMDWPSRIAVPLVGGDELLGVLLVGEKESERRFVKEDLDLLARVGDEAATALERVHLIRRVFEDAEEQRRLQELEAMKSEFLARTAHDLRTPLTSIQWTVQNLADGVMGPVDPRHVPSLQSVLAATNQLARLTSNILDVSRLENPNLPLETGPVALADVVNEALVALRPLGGVANVSLVVRCDDALPPVRGDRGKLVDVASNLIENAIRYSPPGSQVEISLRRAGRGRQTMTVRDHGPGVPEEDRERIFRQFQQGRPSPYSRHRGAGLGLTIVRAAIERMGGSITATNDPQGGARFECTLSDWENA